MDSNRIKNLLLEEHDKDKKLTFLNYGGIAVIGLIVFTFAAIQFFSGASLYVWIVALIFGIGYGIITYKKINKIINRDVEINQVIILIENGERATNISEFKEYKITIPLGKWGTYKLYPIDFIMFCLASQPTKFYRLPINKSFATDFKTLLSGLNPEELAQVKAELYEDKVTKVDNTNTQVESEIIDMSAPCTLIKSVDEFRQFIKTDLSSTIDTIEEKRKSSKNMLIIGSLISIVVVAAFLYFMYDKLWGGEEFSVTSIYISVGVFFALFYVAYFIFIRPKQMAAAKNTEVSVDYTFKTSLLEKIVHFINPDAKYVMHGHIDQREFIESGVVKDLEYNISGNDLVLGKHSGVPFQFCDLKVTYTKSYTTGNEDPDDEVFHGQFFVAKFNKSFQSPVYIVSRRGEAVDYSYVNLIGEKIELEDPEFMKMFNVYGQDQIESRYILTTSLMERIKEMAKLIKEPYCISFYKNRISIFIGSYQDNFELNYFKSLSSKDNKTLVTLFEGLCSEFAIIDDLKLNIKIWR